MIIGLFVTYQIRYGNAMVLVCARLLFKLIIFARCKHCASRQPVMGPRQYGKTMTNTVTFQLQDKKQDGNLINLQVQ